MKKYILLAIPIFYFRHSILYFDLEEMINLTIVLICLTFLLRHTTLKNIFDWIIAVCFVIYFCVLYNKTIQLTGVLSPFQYENFNFSLENIKYVFNTVNLVPIKGIISVIGNKNDLYQIIGNTLMLTPFSFAMLYFKWTKGYKQTIWVSFMCTVGIEFVQFLLCLYYILFNIGMNRSVDIDDVILNTIGAGIGIGCYCLWLKVEKQFNKRKSGIPL